MNRVRALSILVLMFIIGGAVFAQTTVSLEQAIRSGASGIEAGLPPGAKVLVLNFTAPSERFSEYVAEELIMALVRNGVVTVIDRTNLERVQRELNLQENGEISDSSARAIGRFLGVQSIVSGSIEDLGSHYIIRFRTITLEDVEIQVLTRVDVAKDSQTETLARMSRMTPLTAASSPQLRGTIFTLSMGTGLYSKSELYHTYRNSGGSITSSTSTAGYSGVPAPVFINMEFFNYLVVDASLFLVDAKYGGGDGRAAAAIFSLYGQYPVQIGQRLTVLPIMGVAFEMPFAASSGGVNVSRGDMSNPDTLFAKGGVALYYNITDNFRLDTKFIWDFYIYNKDTYDANKAIRERSDMYLYLQHGPSLFVGASYTFLRRRIIPVPAPTT